MDRWHKSTLTPSFSSTLLDSIYRSIDETHPNTQIKTPKPDKNSRSSTHQSSTRSSHSIHGSRFSSSDPESLHVPRISGFNLKPIRTVPAPFHRVSDSKPHDSSFTNPKVLKNYGDLKKVKQPISPGAKLASFLNSMFHSQKKRSEGRKSKSEHTCSTATSFSRSCLSKPVLDTVKMLDKKRSVRFVEDESRLRVLNHGYGDRVNVGSRRVECDDDASSCSSSDLFELDNLGGLEELPVYETTRLGRNGLFV